MAFVTHASRTAGSRLAALMAAGATLAVVPAPAAAQAAEDSLVLEEIVVTARKRQETLFSVPMSLAVLTAGEIERADIETSVDLVGRIPGLSLSSDGLSPGRDFRFLVIRGVGSTTSGDPAVPVFIDGVYQPRLGFDAAFFDVERVEVLRGPQGTLFGRNTEGGAVNIVTRRPDDETRGRVGFLYDEFNTLRAQGQLSGPIAEGWAASVAFSGETTDGWLDNPVVPARAKGDLNTVIKPADANDGRDIYGRAALRYHGRDDLEFMLSADIQDFKGLAGLPGVPRGCRCYDVFTEFQLDERDRNRGVSAHLEKDLAFGTLTAITGWRHLSTRLPFDFDGGADVSGNIHDFRTRQDFLSEELRLAGARGALDWLAGVYVFREKLDSRRRYDLPNNPMLPGLVIRAQDVLSRRVGFAAFLQGSWRIADDLELTLGGRFSKEWARAKLAVDFSIAGFGVDVVDSDLERARFDSLTGLASLSWHASDEVLVYATVSQGYKAGGFPIAPLNSVDFTAFDDERTINFEAGVRARTRDRSFVIDAAVFHVLLRDQQLSTAVTIDGLPVSTIANAGKSHSTGFELDVTWRPASFLTLHNATGLAATNIDDYVDAEGRQHRGERFRFTPKWTSFTEAVVTRPVALLGEEGEARLSFAHRFVGRIIQGFGVFADPVFDIGSYNILDVRLALDLAAWRLEIFAENVTDNYVETRAWNTFFFIPDGSRVFSTLLPPRRVGGRISYSF